VIEIEDDEWRTIFELIVDPLPRFLKAVVPGMNARGGGITSASGAGLITTKPWESDG
jgi:2-keto-3-deoxy-L-fuconate dehydrogenase